MSKENIKRKIISVDLDNTLTNGEPFYKETPTVNQKVANWVKQQYFEGNVIIIYTSRKQWYYLETKKWLDKNQIYYHCLVMGKLTADVYLDDRNMLLSEVGLKISDSKNAGWGKIKIGGKNA